MKKDVWESKTIQGVVLAVGAYVWGVWSGNSDIQYTVVAAGLGWAGIGARLATDKK